MSEATPISVPVNTNPTTIQPITTRPAHRAIDRTYHPRGYGMSQSLLRARRPFFFRNALVGTTVALFVAGVYTYSISAVQQDDFSDVEDLLPPLEERSKLRSIEDDARETSRLRAVASVLPSTSASDRALDTPLPSSTSTGSSLSKALPSAGAGSDVRAAEEIDFGAADGERLSWWGRLSGSARSQRGGEVGTGRLGESGILDVERIGRVGDGGVTEGPRRV
ncbi:MAG: hypothetical protein TREMPRED_001496 [Tremellales sp. Tagirdzhanova-0007]|nr:MAG: hypothetical protein TREMPRED_001496 [Tremellales sp. Tagirdzhanova-0007]